MAKITWKRVNLCSTTPEYPLYVWESDIKDYTGLSKEYSWAPAMWRVCKVIDFKNHKEVTKCWEIRKHDNYKANEEKMAFPVIASNFRTKKEAQEYVQWLEDRNLE